VALRKDSHARNAPVRREVVEVDVQERCSSNLHTPLQCPLDVTQIVESLRAEEVDDQVATGEADAIAFDEEVLPVLVRPAHLFAILRTGRVSKVFLLGGA